MGGNAQRVEEVHVRLSYRVFTDTVGSTLKHNLPGLYSVYLSLVDLSVLAILGFYQDKSP